MLQPAAHAVTGQHARLIENQNAWSRPSIRLNLRLSSTSSRRRNHMNIGWQSARGFIVLVSLSICWSACQQDDGLNTTAPSSEPLSKTAGQANGILAAA